MAAYRQVLSFVLIGITQTPQTVCINPLNDSEAASGIKKIIIIIKTNIFRRDECIHQNHLSTTGAIFAVKVRIFYMNSPYMFVPK